MNSSTKEGDGCLLPSPISLTFCPTTRMLSKSTQIFLYSTLDTRLAFIKNRCIYFLNFATFQIMLMMGTILGPGTIFLMLTGAFNSAFKVSNWDAFLINLVPILGKMCLKIVFCSHFDCSAWRFLASINVSKTKSISLKYPILLTF